MGKGADVYLGSPLTAAATALEGKISGPEAIPMKFKGKVWKYGDNVDTDVIIPGKYLRTADFKVFGEHAMEGIDPGFKPATGDIIVAGKNFGCGSSREQAPLAIKYAGISCVVAKSFARIFFRNAINVGLAHRRGGRL